MHIFRQVLPPLLTGRHNARLKYKIVNARSRVYEIEAATVFHCRVAGDLAEVLSGAGMDVEAIRCSYRLPRRPRCRYDRPPKPKGSFTTQHSHAAPGESARRNRRSACELFPSATG